MKCKCIELSDILEYEDNDSCKAKYTIMQLQQENQKLKENYERIYNENCILREKHNINDIVLLDENYKLKQVIDKAIKYIKERFYFNEETGEDALLHTFDRCNVKELLDILKEVK